MTKNKALLEPDYTEKREEIESHKYVSLKLDLGIIDPVTGNESEDADWGKVLFTTSDSAIVQAVELEYGSTRFKVYKIALGEEWDMKFVEWIDEDWEGTNRDGYDTSYSVVHECWQEGAKMYFEEI